MAWRHFIWTDEDVEHLAEHDITPGDFEHVVKNPDEHTVSHSSGLPCVFGYTPDGRYIIAVLEERRRHRSPGYRL